MKTIDRDKHFAYHRFTGNATVREALLEVLRLSENAITSEYMEDLAKILKIKDPEYIYKKGVWIPHKYNDT